MEEPEKIVSQTELDDKAQKLVEEKDADSRLRVYVGPMEKALTAVLLIWAVFQVWANMFGTLGAVKLRTAHIMFLLPLAFTLYPTFKKERRRRRLMPVWDIALIAAAILSYGYLFMRYDAIARTGRLNSTDVWVGVVCLVVAFEAARRASGNLAIIALIFLSYFAVWGRYIPGTFGTSAFTLKRVIKALVWDTNGVLGTGAGVSATYIFVFVLFGAFLKYSGFSQFINDIALTLVGQTPGGPAKVAVISSAAFGTISGAAAANVVGTGTFTIPLMKKCGYPPEFAGAVEACASTGGQLIPPVMGAACFIMAEYIGVPYSEIMLAGLVPGFLYYMSVFVTVHLRSKKLGLNGMPKEQLPSVRAAMKSRGHLLIPFAAVIYLIIRQYTISFAALVGIILVLLVSPLKKETRMSWKQIAAAFVDGGKKTVSFGVSCACVGMIIGVTTLTGVGNVLGNYILDISQGNLFLTLILVMIMSIIMGMGMPTVAVYIVQATVTAPVLMELGIPALTAHFFCFYFGIIACITPPVAVPSYAAAAIAGSNPSSTGWAAFKMAIPAFLIPFVFVYEPGMLFNGGSTVNSVICIFTSIIGCFLVAAGMEGWVVRPLIKWKRILALAGGICCIIPEHITDIIGVAVLAFLVISECRAKKLEQTAVS